MRVRTRDNAQQPGGTGRAPSGSFRAKGTRRVNSPGLLPLGKKSQDGCDVNSDSERAPGGCRPQADTPPSRPGPEKRSKKPRTGGHGPRDPPSAHRDETQAVGPKRGKKTRPWLPAANTAQRRKQGLGGCRKIPQNYGPRFEPDRRRFASPETNRRGHRP